MANFLLTGTFGLARLLHHMAKMLKMRLVRERVPFDVFGFWSCSTAIRSNERHTELAEAPNKDNTASNRAAVSYAD